MNYSVTTSPAAKTTITIDRKTLWDNYVTSWKDIAWDSPELINDLSDFKSTANTLCVEPLNYKVQQLFRRGDTVLLLGDAMRHIDLPTKKERDNTLFEIIVVEEGCEPVIVQHQDIRY
jgi:hypothetical protein